MENKNNNHDELRFIFNFLFLPLFSSRSSNMTDESLIVVAMVIRVIAENNFVSPNNNNTNIRIINKKQEELS